MTTRRLVLSPVTNDDVDELYALSSDPRVWTHLPSGRHTSREQTAEQVSYFVGSWTRYGLGYCLARDADGDFVGVGGCMASRAGTWNIYFRVRPEHQRRGYAVEIARAGMAAARETDPARAITAHLLERNTASRATVERLGLSQMWRGPDADVADGVRLVYADRALDPGTLHRLVSPG